MIEREGRQFGIETRVRLYVRGKERVGEQVAETAGVIYCFALACKVWGWRRGYGWLPVK